MFFQKKTLWFLTILLSFFLSACGFHLRQNTQLPDSLRNITLELHSGSNIFDRDLRIALDQSDIKILTAIQENELVYELKVNKLTSEDTILARASDNDVTQIQRRITVTYFVRDTEGQSLYGPRSISTSIMLNNQDAEQSLKSAYNEEQMQRSYRRLASELVYDLNYAPL